MLIGRAIRKWGLDEAEADTFRRVLFSAMFLGIMNSIWLIIPEVARNTLRAEKIFIPILTLMWPVGQLGAVYWSSYLDGKSDKSSILLAVGFFGRFPLIFGALFSRIEPILFCFLFMVLSFPAATASFHSIIQSNVRKDVRGKFFSYHITTSTLTSMFFAMMVGWLLDHNEQNYRWLIMAAGVAGLLEMVVLARIPLRKGLNAVFGNGRPSPHPLSRIVEPWRDFIRLFREDRAFLRYELNFFVYGVGFMILQPFVSLFFVNDLSLSYMQITLAKATILQAGIVGLAPLMGRFFDRFNPTLYAAAIFLSITVFPLLLIVTGLGDYDNPQYMVYFAYALFSVGWSGIGLVWNLGNMFFVGNRDVSRYTTAHIAMVGLRGMVGMILAVCFVEWITSVMAFAFTAVCWLLGAFLMFHQWWTQYRGKEEETDGSS